MHISDSVIMKPHKYSDLGTLHAFLFERKKKQKSRAVAHLDASEVDAAYDVSKRFLGRKWRAEMDAPGALQEVNSRMVNVMLGPPVELDAAQGERGGR